MTPDPEAFLQRFRRFGASAGVESYLDLFAEDGTLYDEGMATPLTRADIPVHIETLLAMLRDFRMVPERWRFRGSRLFVEARNDARVGEALLHWRAAYVVALEGGRVKRGRRYYDRAPLLAAAAGRPRATVAPDLAEVDELRVAPAEPTRPLRERYVDALSSGDFACLPELFREDAALVLPGVSRPLGRSQVAAAHAWLRSQVRDARFELLDWAGDGVLEFLEWRVSGTRKEAPFTIGIVDRLDCIDGAILHARSYLDTLTLLGC